MRAFIPPEILSLIFMHALPTCCADRELGPDSSPILLTLVSRYWRAVAQSTPRLWVDLYLPDVPRTVQNIDPFFTAIQNWLSYSGSQPISLTLSSEEWDKNILARYLSILCAHSGRWKSIYFDFRIVDPIIFPVLNRQTMPFLESFSYQTHDPEVTVAHTDAISPSAWTVWDSLSCAPRLHTIRLVHPISTLLLTPSPSITTIDIKIVTTLDPITVDLAHFLLCVGSCPNLEFLRISYEGEEEDIVLLTTGVTQIRLPNLRTLSLFIDQAPYLFKALLDSILAPNLQRFEIAASESNRELYDSLGDFILRVSPTLRSFDSSGKLLNDADLAEACQRLSHLTSLSAWDYMVAENSFIKALRLHFHPDGRLRFGQNTNLKDLNIYVAGSWSGFGCTFAEYYMQILEAVQSRWRLPVGAKDYEGNELERMREVKFAGWSEYRIRQEAPVAYAMLMRFRMEGLMVKFSSDWNEEAY